MAMVNILVVINLLAVINIVAAVNILVLILVGSTRNLAIMMIIRSKQPKEIPCQNPSLLEDLTCLSVHDKLRAYSPTYSRRLAGKCAANLKVITTHAQTL